MPESAIPGLYRVRLEYTGFEGVSGALYNVLHYLDTADPQHDYTNQEVADIVQDAVESFWETVGVGGGAALNTFYADGTPSQVFARNLNKDEVEAQAATGAAAGTSASFQLPAEVACCVSLATALAGRSYRGRMYLPPPATSAMAATGLFGTTYTIAAKASVDTWLRSVTGNVLQLADLDLVVYSRLLDDANIVTATRVNTSPDTQRNRGIR